MWDWEETVLGHGAGQLRDEAGEVPAVPALAVWVPLLLVVFNTPWILDLLFHLDGTRMICMYFLAFCGNTV